ncbi:protein BREAKING OF ASYMMETRY IN THE STOMATAL LINEAGE-like [Apium graveolens]|uniref:protein BREAKING OF ASYMMETRY IN THE STOMATAL LINEAGE-like n=1 Tax=Apium graveolens TaxID=4045 RepID=UPI003D79D7DB
MVSSMNVALKWTVKDCASTLYACRIQLDEQDMISKPMTKKKDSRENKRAKNDDMKQPPIADKEYIVFRFREDGGIDLVEEKWLTSNSDSRIHHIHHNHKTLKELMMFDENSESLQFKVNEDGLIISDEEGEEEQTSNESGKELSPSDENDDGVDIKVITAIEDSTEHKTLSDSTRSDSSSGSFAFPILNMEMKGSPERMPKYNKQRHKLGRILQFPCCRF